MNRYQLEHVLRAAAGITGADRFIVIGSQAILGQVPNPPPELVASAEVDVFTTRSQEDADLIDGSIGEGSPFHQSFGYYAHGVGEDTAVLPQGWADRLVPVRTANTGGATGLCLDVHDLAISKLVAGRDKDIAFLSSLLRHGLTTREMLLSRLVDTSLRDDLRELCLARVDRLTR